MKTTPCQSLGQIASSKLLNRKKLSKLRKRQLASCLFLPPLFKKSGGETVNKIGIKKALAKSLVTFTPKGPNCYPRTDFCKGTIPESMPLPQSRTSKGSKSVKKICWQGTCYWIGERCTVRAGGHVVDAQKSIKTDWDGVVQNVAKKESAATIRQYEDGLSVCLNQQGPGLKKSQNNGV